MASSSRAFAGLGYVSIASQYRLTGQGRWPAQIEDVKAAIRWTRANAARLNIDADKIAIAGYSAGGLMALAGPAANFTLMIIAAIVIRIGLGSGWLGSSPDGRPGMLDIILDAFFRLNLLLGIFNLFPVPPLDGSTGVMVFMDDSTARRYMNWLRTTPYRSLGLLVALLAFRYFYAPVEKFATNLLLYTRF